MEVKRQEELKELKRQSEEEQKKKQALAAIKAKEDALDAEKKQKEADEEKRIARENEKLNAEKRALNRLAPDEVLKEEDEYRQALKYINDNWAKNPQLKQASLESRKNITLALNTLTNDRIKILEVVRTRLFISLFIIYYINVYIFFYNNLLGYSVR